MSLTIFRGAASTSAVVHLTTGNHGPAAARLALLTAAGPQAAQQLLAFLSRLFGWYAARNNDFLSPIVRGMGRVKPKERASKRVLNDAEIRDVRKACRPAPSVCHLVTPPTSGHCCSPP